jgi:hypothetical protein
LRMATRTTTCSVHSGPTKPHPGSKLTSPILSFRSPDLRSLTKLSHHLCSYEFSQLKRQNLKLRSQLSQRGLSRHLVPKDNTATITTTNSSPSSSVSGTTVGSKEQGAGCSRTIKATLLSRHSTSNPPYPPSRLRINSSTTAFTQPAPPSSNSNSTANATTNLESNLESKKAGLSLDQFVPPHSSADPDSSRFSLGQAQASLTVDNNQIGFNPLLKQYVLFPSLSLNHCFLSVPLLVFVCSSTLTHHICLPFFVFCRASGLSSSSSTDFINHPLLQLPPPPHHHTKIE